MPEAPSAAPAAPTATPTPAGPASGASAAPSPGFTGIDADDTPGAAFERADRMSIAFIGATGGALPQAASVPTMAAQDHHTRTRPMTLLLLEALGAGLLLVGIIWWTMFSGRKNGEITQAATSTEAPEAEILDKK